MSAVVACVLWVVLPACASGAHRAAGPPSTLTAAESDRLEQAQELLVARCMVGHGFSYTVPPPNATPRAAPDFAYGIDDATWAREHGYGLADQARFAEARHDSPNARYAAGLPAARQADYDVALFGTPGQGIAVTVPAGQTVTQSADGCLARAQGQLYGDFGRWFRASTITENLLPAIQPKVFGDARYQRAVAAWSECARAAGHPAGSPDELRAQALEADPAGERELAVTDATCNRQARLAETGWDLDRELGAPVRARYQAESRAYAQMRGVALSRAGAALQGTS